jgi:RNA polymerase sigma-70 factor (ECF subfamily)
MLALNAAASLTGAAWSGAAAFPAGSAETPGLAGEPVDQDQACMRRLARGETEALRPLFDRWKLPLMTYFYRSIGSHADAEDLTLRTFENVYRASGRYRPEARFSTWLFAIARNELRHEWRRLRRKPVEALPAEMFDRLEGHAGEASSTYRELEEHLLAGLRTLPERQRTALLLASAGELDHTAIAGTLRISVNNLNVILHRARASLRRALGALP